jgi:adenosylcobinamide-phosphate synthase
VPRGASSSARWHTTARSGESTHRASSISCWDAARQIIELAFLALLIEAGLGYPEVVLRAIGHPVSWIGRLINFLDRRLNKEHRSDAIRRTAGLLAVLISISIAAIVCYIVQFRLVALPFGTLATAILASTLIAQRSLYDHVARVAAALETTGVAAGREAVSHIVGRDPDVLDAAGIARAAIESLAESFSDAVVAPAFWLAVAGLPGIAVYKTINTADSMIGHRTPRHRAFGCAAARLDDLVNLPASRLSVLLIVAAAGMSNIASISAAWRAVMRDAASHRSPNAGYPEAAMAGALGLALAGPRVYGGVRIDDAFMGDGRKEATAADIRAALSLYVRADALLIALTGALWLLVIALT